jgi:hypothetical protein
MGHRRIDVRLPRLAVVLVTIASFAFPLAGQSTNGTINGLVLDPSNSAIAGADILVINDATGVKYSSKTNSEGIYLLPSLPPGPYRLQVSKIGFKTLIKPDITLNVQDALSINFTLPIGAALETVTVQGGAPLIDTESAAVGTVVDRQFAENLPMNGRSFQALIELAPGVVTVPANSFDNGQFSVNGQRSSANYWMVDGVGANIGTSPLGGTGSGLEGSQGSFSVFGGTNSLVSVDALQEFRIQTSTYAPEFGRTPGAQISIATRSGTNRFHGTAFDYLRNDVFDANDWFADAHNLAKPEERQNDFGGTFSGPFVKGRTFFFFSYEGLRLRLPQTALGDVPDISARQNASLGIRPFLNAFPLPNGADNQSTGVAVFDASYSDPGALNAYSLRVDHRLNDKLSLFGRYNYSPSVLVQRGENGLSLSTLGSARVTTQTMTLGNNWVASPRLANDLRLNYSRVDAASNDSADNFGGAVPLTSLGVPSPYTSANAFLEFIILPLASAHGTLGQGQAARVLQQQFNLVDALSMQAGSHSLKFGVDFRRLSPRNTPALYQQLPIFQNVASAETGSLLLTVIESSRSVKLLFRDLGAYAQDTWRATPHLTLTYGIRWDVDFSPSSLNGPNLPSVTGFNLHDLSQLALAPSGTAPFQTTFGNVAPRFGVAYQISQKSNWETVLRGGIGLFFDLASSQTSNLVGLPDYPFGNEKLAFGGTFPLSANVAAPAPITTPTASSPGRLPAFDPQLKLPYTLEWNFALQQALGAQQSFSASYVGSAGKRLLQTADVLAPSPSFTGVALVTNAGISDYDALQMEFQRRLSRGLQALASYSWSHSIDTGSAGSYGNEANALVPALGANANRGSSDFDIRNAFSMGLTYDFPSPKIDGPLKAILRGWSTDNIVHASSAPPVNIFDGSFSFANIGITEIRPDLTPGIPLYLYGSRYAGGKIFNSIPSEGGPGCVGPFCPPPTDANGNALRQGDLGRNTLRGFGLVQWDFAVHREFPIRESLKLQFRAEIFNVLNHPNFGQPNGDISQLQFGQSTQMLGQSLSGGQVGGGAFDPLYQIGGPRSIQVALKLMF